MEQTSICNLCSNFKEKVILDVALAKVHTPICGGHLEERVVVRIGSGWGFLQLPMRDRVEAVRLNAADGG